MSLNRRNMYYLSKMCCFCLSLSSEPFIYLNQVLEDERLSYLDKLSATLSRLTLDNKLRPDYMLCKKCCDVIDMVYKFGSVCEVNLEHLASYQQMLSAPVKKRCNVHVKLRRFKQKSNERQYSNYTSRNSSLINDDHVENDTTNSDDSCSSTSESSDSDTDDNKSDINNKKPKFEVATYPSKNEIRKIMMNPKNEKKHICNLCNKSFRWRHTFDLHKLKHAEIKSHVCKVCKKQFRTKQHLDNHDRLHARVGPKLACTLCETGAHGPAHERHVRTAQKGTKKSVCSVCNKQFLTNGALRSHARIHTGLM